MHKILVEVVLLGESEGGRRTPPNFATGGYMPHIVLGDPAQRKPVMVGNEVGEEYLGVKFVSGPERADPGKKIIAEAVLLWYPEVQYLGVSMGATFTIREGPRILGFGTVLRRTDEAG